jgi:hypothetical protein
MVVSLFDLYFMKIPAYPLKKKLHNPLNKIIKKFKMKNMHINGETH